MPTAVPIDAEELAALRRDAARYRWLVQVAPVSVRLRIFDTAIDVEIDDAVDRAMFACDLVASWRDDEIHEPIKVFGFGSEYDEERALDNRERAADMNRAGGR